MIRVTRSAIIDAPIERVWAVLRDFNSHTAWHPVVAESASRTTSVATRSAACATSRCKDGNHIREQLLALSDRDHISTYCILDATLPLQRYVATVQLKPVTDGDRTFWHWQSTFDTPRGREREFADLVGKGVYEGGFEGLRAFLRRGGAGAPRTAARGPPPAMPMTTAGASSSSRFGGPEVLEAATARGAARRGRARCASGSARSASTTSTSTCARGEYRAARAAGAARHGSGRHGARRRRRRRPSAAGRPRRLCLRAAGRLCRRAHRAGRARSWRCRTTIDDETAAALMLKGMTAEYLLHRTHRVRAGDTRPGARGGRRRRAAAVPLGQGARRAGDRHGLERRQGARCARQPAATPSSSAATTASPTRCTTRPAAAAPT